MAMPSAPILGLLLMPTRSDPERSNSVPYIRCAGEGRVIGGQPPYRKGTSPSAPQFWVGLLLLILTPVDIERPNSIL